LRFMRSEGDAPQEIPVLSMPVPFPVPYPYPSPYPILLSFGIGIGIRVGYGDGDGEKGWVGVQSGCTSSPGIGGGRMA
jgi:hypothetical protein